MHYFPTGCKKLNRKICILNNNCTYNEWLLWRINSNTSDLILIINRNIWILSYALNKVNRLRRYDFVIPNNNNVFCNNYALCFCRVPSIK